MIHLIGFYDYKMLYFLALEALISQFPTHPVYKIEFALHVKWNATANYPDTESEDGRLLSSFFRDTPNGVVTHLEMLQIQVVK